MFSSPIIFQGASCQVSGVYSVVLFDKVELAGIGSPRTIRISDGGDDVADAQTVIRLFVLNVFGCVFQASWESLHYAKSYYYCFPLRRWTMVFGALEVGPGHKPMVPVA